MRIGELSRRTGVSPDRLRAWERRYGLLRPRRTQGGTRLYSGADERRVQLMLRALSGGYSAAEAAEVAGSARIGVPPGVAPAIGGPEADATRRELEAALYAFDETGAQRALERLFAAFTPLAVVRDVLLPTLREVGDRWADGHATVAQEHFASSFIHARLMALARGWDRGSGSRAVLACAPGEQHCLGLIAYGIAMHEAGWRIVYLGADCPVAMTASAAAEVDAELVVVGAALPDHLVGNADALRSLAEQVPLVIGGGGAGREVAGRIGARLAGGDLVEAAFALDPAAGRR